MKTKRIKTSKKNTSPKLLKLECENCGAVLTMVDKKHALCRYCGQRYRIDETEGRLILDVNIRHIDGDAQTAKALKWIAVVLAVFLLIAILIIKEIWEYNVPARESELVEQPGEPVREEDGDLLRIFCQDIFGKKYEEITPQEFASLRYIEYDYLNEGEGFNVLHYSFSDYKDCDSEEAFQETIKQWTCANANTPTDFTMFPGITRVDTYNSVDLSKMTFAEDARITYVRTDESLEKIKNSVDLAEIEVLYIGNFFDIGYLDSIEECINLKEVYVDAGLEYSDEPLDLQIFQQNTKLEKIWIECGNEKFAHVEALGDLTNLKVFYVENLQLKDCDFFHKLTRLEELHIEAETYPEADFLQHMPNLRVLRFLQGGYVEAQDLAHLKKVENLDVCIDSQDALEVLGRLSSLRVLNLYTDDNPADFGNGNVVDVSVLGQLETLETLYLSGSFYQGMETVWNLPALEEVSIGSFAVDPEKLQRNESVREIKLFYNMVFDANTGEALALGEFLKYYPQVEVLKLNGCDLTDIQFLAQFQELRECSLQYNAIQDFSPLYECKKLEKVSIFGNPYAEEDLRFSEEVVVAQYPWE